MGTACKGMCIGAIADQQDEISLWKLKLVAVVAEIHCNHIREMLKNGKTRDIIEKSIL